MKDPQCETVATQLEQLAKQIRESPNAQVKLNRQQLATVPGNPTAFTGEIKLRLEVYLPELRSE